MGTCLHGGVGGSFDVRHASPGLLVDRAVPVFGGRSLFGRAPCSSFVGRVEGSVFFGRGECTSHLHLVEIVLFFGLGPDAGGSGTIEYRYFLELL